MARKKQPGSGFNIKELVRGGGGGGAPSPMASPDTGAASAPVRKGKKKSGNGDVMPMMKQQAASTPAPMMTYMGQ